MYLIGVILFLAVVAGLGLLSATLGSFIDFPSLFVILGLSLSILLASGLLPDFLKGFKLMGAKENPFTALELKRIRRACRLAIQSFLLGGFVGTMIGSVGVLASLNDPAKIGPNLAVAMLTVLYALIFVFLVLPVQAKVKTVLDTLE